MRSTENLDFKQQYISPISHHYQYKTPKGLTKNIVKTISKRKNEPSWMTDFRLQAYTIFQKKPLPAWGVDLTNIDFDSITYYLSPTKSTSRNWDDVPKEIKNTYEVLGIPKAERDYLSGVTAQMESEIVYEGIRKELSQQGVLFLDTGTALTKYPELFQEYFGKIVTPGDNTFAALNSAVWSGGSFIYIPKGIQVKLPLQAFFLINAKNVGQFERTLIIADENSYVHYIEGCTAPQYSTASLHAAVVEVFVKKNARVRYTTIQNWSKNVYNLTTKRAYVSENGIMEWVDANIGSKATMKYPACILAGQHARGEVLSLSYANNKQHQDTGAKMIHLAPHTHSRIISKSISKSGGRSSYRGMVIVNPGAFDSSVTVSCDTMLLDDKSRSDTYPVMKIREKDTEIQHETTVEKIGEEKLFYLASRGIDKSKAESLLVNGFIEPIIKEIPLEYAIEMNRLINLEMSGSIG